MPTASSDFVKFEKEGMIIQQMNIMRLMRFYRQWMSNEQCIHKKFTCRWKKMLEGFL